MSRHNVEVVRRAIEATNRGRGTSILAIYDPDVELISRGPLGELVGSGSYRGREGIRHFFQAFLDAWEHVEYNIEELIDAGDRVRSFVTFRGRGRVSGAEVELRIPGVWTFRDGMVSHVVFFPEDARPGDDPKR